MAGVAGFEPAHAGIKTRCLTAWRHPICLTTETVLTLHCTAAFLAEQPAVHIKSFSPPAQTTLSQRSLHIPATFFERAIVLIGLSSVKRLYDITALG
jgi:hypothetical protein